jgi:hypothetical protein
MPIVHLREKNWDVTAFFFNPNIHPADEWKKRRDAMREVAEKLCVPLIEEGSAINPGLWVQNLHGQKKEGERCTLCYRPRMERTAELAMQLGFEAFTTSLLYSRYQHHEAIIQQANQAAHIYRASFYYQDFRPWWWDGIAMSKKLGIYRQKWCGCILSMKEARIQQQEAAVRKAAQKAERAARLQKETEERQERKQAIAAAKALRQKKTQIMHECNPSQHSKKP